MSAIKRLDYVTYHSSQDPAKWRSGRVVSVHDDRAVVEHETAPKITVLPCSRLMILAKPPTRQYASFAAPTAPPDAQG